MPRVTALRPARPGRVLVELDGKRWRTISVDVAARSGLAVGLELDRERLRALARELRRAGALDAGVQALNRRDRSEHSVQSALERQGIARAEREEAVATLRRYGALDDGRFARSRAAALAERGFGDAAIAFKLEQDGVGREAVAEGIAALEPERERASRLAARRGRTQKTARWLAARGFDADSVEAAVASVAGSDGSQLGYE
ncbi:MAG TPA: RecX family transcriptional regulator [Gaiellaceae bacterium]|nr:RecX family transcriptional regulator [Gaiellaceae bacterium]